MHQTQIALTNLEDLIKQGELKVARKYFKTVSSLAGSMTLSERDQIRFNLCAAAVNIHRQDLVVARQHLNLCLPSSAAFTDLKIKVLLAKAKLDLIEKAYESAEVVIDEASSLAESCDVADCVPRFEVALAAFDLKCRQRQITAAETILSSLQTTFESMDQECKAKQILPLLLCHCELRRRQNKKTQLRATVIKALQIIEAGGSQNTLAHARFLRYQFACRAMVLTQLPTTLIESLAICDAKLGPASEDCRELRNQIADAYWLNPQKWQDCVPLYKSLIRLEERIGKFVFSGNCRYRLHKLGFVSEMSAKD